MKTQVGCKIRNELVALDSDPNLALASSQSAASNILDNIDNPSSLMIRPTFSTNSSDYQTSYAYKIKAITTDQIDTRINLA